MVIRRVGGLEVSGAVACLQQTVIRRVGGLEDAGTPYFFDQSVIRRVGGLEAHRGAGWG